jgi:hypothetical protein
MKDLRANAITVCVYPWVGRIVADFQVILSDLLRRVGLRATSIELHLILVEAGSSLVQEVGHGID